MRIIFAGTPDFAATSLAALLASDHQVVAVLTQPDRRGKRGNKLVPSEVKQLAEQHQLPVLQPEKLKDPAIHNQLRAFGADVMVVVAYGLIIPKAVLDIPRYGCLNVHASLLPRWRGAAPVERAIEAGDTETGVTIMQMDEGLDTGPMLHKVTVSVGTDETGGSLTDRLASLGAEALVKVLDDLPGYLARAEPQPDTGITYASKLTNADSELDWSCDARELFNQVRALSSSQTTQTKRKAARAKMGDTTVQIHACEIVEEQTNAPPGTIIAINPKGLDIACGHGILRLTELQLPGKKAMSVKTMLNGRMIKLDVGQPLDSGS